MPKLPQGVMAFPGKTRDVLRQAAAWVERQTLKVKHADTLARFHNKEYGNKDDTIGVVDAFSKGLLDPQALLSPLLVTQIDKLMDKTLRDPKLGTTPLTNKAVLESWNRVTLEAMQARTDGKSPPGAIPLNTIMRTATYRGDTDTLQWLATLENPSEKIDWSPQQLLLNDLKTAHWALMWHQELLKTDEPHRFVHASLTPKHFISSRWFTHKDADNTTYESSLRDMRDVENHAHNIMWLYFREMPWQERWSTFVDTMVPASPVEPSMRSGGMQGLMQGRIFIAGLLYNAPMDVQKCLAAFKNSRHPKEETDLSCDVEAKAIRHTFFGGPSPQGVVPAPLATWLSMMQGTPKEEAGAAWVQWYTNAHTMTADMDVPLPDSLFDLQGSP